MPRVKTYWLVGMPKCPKCLTYSLEKSNGQYSVDETLAKED